MYKSKAHLAVRHERIDSLRFQYKKVTYVPASYFTIIQSRDFETSRHQAIQLALGVVTGKPMIGDMEVDESVVYDEHGRILPQDVLAVNEHSNGFSVTHNATGKNHWLSDGVDCLFFDEGYDPEESVTLHPGTIGFVQVWTEFMNKDSEAMEAYFPDLMDAEDK